MDRVPSPGASALPYKQTSRRLMHRTTLVSEEAVA